MSTYNEMMYCLQCEKHTMHLRDKTNHILHLIISVITFGVWLIIWALVAWSNSTQNQCTVCGRTRNWGIDKPPRRVSSKQATSPPKTMEEILRDGE